MAWLSDTNNLMSLGDWAVMNYDPDSNLPPQKQEHPKSTPPKTTTPPKPPIKPGAIYDLDGDGVPETTQEELDAMFDDGGDSGGDWHGFAPDPWTSTQGAAEFDAEQRRLQDERAQQYWKEQFAAENEAKKAAAELEWHRQQELEKLNQKFQLTRDEQQYKRDLERDSLDYRRRKEEADAGRAFEATENEKDRAYKSGESEKERAWQTQLETMKAAAEEKRFQAQLADNAADRDQRYQIEAMRLNQEAALAEKQYDQAIKLEDMRQKGDITLEQIRQTGAMEQLKFQTAAEYKMKLEDLKAQRYNTFVEMLGKDPVRAVLFGLGLGPQAEAYNQQERMYNEAMLPLLGGGPRPPTGTPGAGAPAPTSGGGGGTGAPTGTAAPTTASLKQSGGLLGKLLGGLAGGNLGGFGKVSGEKAAQLFPQLGEQLAAATPSGAPAATPGGGEGVQYYDPRVSSLSQVMPAIPGAAKLKGDVETALSNLLGRQISVGGEGVSGLGSAEQAATAYQKGDENIQTLLASAFGVGDLGGAGGISPEGLARKVQAVTPTGILRSP